MCIVSGAFREDELETSESNGVVDRVDRRVDIDIQLQFCFCNICGDNMRTFRSYKAAYIDESEQQTQRINTKLPVYFQRG